MQTYTFLLKETSKSAKIYYIKCKSTENVQSKGIKKVSKVIRP